MRPSGWSTSPGEWRRKIKRQSKRRHGAPPQWRNGSLMRWYTALSTISRLIRKRHVWSFRDRWKWSKAHWWPAWVWSAIYSELVKCFCRKSWNRRESWKRPLPIWCHSWKRKKRPGQKRRRGSWWRRWKATSMTLARTSLESCFNVTTMRWSIWGWWCRRQRFWRRRARSMPTWSVWADWSRPRSTRWSTSPRKWSGKPFEYRCWLAARRRAGRILRLELRHTIVPAPCTCSTHRVRSGSSTNW